MRYRVSVHFSGVVSLDMEADSPEAARLIVADMTLPDLARQGQADVHALKIAAREITLSAALSGDESETGGESQTPKPRPSGWYRPR